MDCTNADVLPGGLLYAVVPIETAQLISRIRDALDERKALNSVVLDVQGISSVTDYYVIATGTSAPHLKALAEAVEIPIKHDGSPVYHRSGTPDSGWMVMDYVDVVVHIMSAEMRDYYALEKLWGDARVIAEVDRNPAARKIS